MNANTGKRLPEEAIEKARKFCVDEYFDYNVYKYLAGREGNPRLREILETLAREEYEHYLFWKKVLRGDCKASLPGWKLRLILLARKVFGLTFTLKLLEMHEDEVIAEYKAYMKHLEGSDREELERIIADEEKHENELISGINEAIVRYLSFIALGIADAIVEITGVHAGFLGATRVTEVAGIAGLIVGVSAAFSMAGAAYLQAKAEAVVASERSPGKSALVTGLSYLGSVVILALPYFLTKSMATAFTVSLLMAIAIVSSFTFYNAVLNEADFKRELAENLSILFGTAIIAFLFGEVIGSVFHISTII